MGSGARYDPKTFMADAQRILGQVGDLSSAQDEIAERLSHLAARDDLTRFGAQIGPSDAANGTFLIWREPPHFALLMVQFDEGWMSPVHDHQNHWIVACGYRGADRWDMYERKDDGNVMGHADLQLVDQVVVRPGDTISMPPPPRAIHSHNNVHNGPTLELIFSAAPPSPAAERHIYDVEASSCQPSWFEVSDQLVGDYFPPRQLN